MTEFHFNNNVKLITESDKGLNEEFNSVDKTNIYLIEAKNHKFLTSIPFHYLVYCLFYY